MKGRAVLGLAGTQRVSGPRVMRSHSATATSRQQY
jgi:hypothetical protein